MSCAILEKDFYLGALGSFDHNYFACDIHPNYDGKNL